MAIHPDSYDPLKHQFREYRSMVIQCCLLCQSYYILILYYFNLQYSVSVKQKICFCLERMVKQMSMSAGLE
jgi:hypothetical protein